MRAVVYTRQSLDRSGEGAAVARQLEDCEKLAELRGWTIVERFSDNDVSAAGKKQRPGFEAVLKALEEDRATVVIAWALDRLTRNRRDELRLIELCEAKAATIALVRGTDLDMSTPAGILVADVMGATARHEIKQKGDRQRRALQQAAEAGRWAGGQRPFGYAKDGTTVVEVEAEHLRQAYADLLRGASLKSIAKRWNDAGALTTAGGTWTHTTVRRALQNPRYAGLRRYRGQVVGKATWPPLVDEATHEAAVALLSAPERRTAVSLARKWLLPSLALCGVCGSDVTTGHNPSSRGGARLYVCRAKKCVSRKAEPVDAYIGGGEVEWLNRWGRSVEHVRGVVVERLSRPDAIELLADRDDPDLERHKGKRDDILRRLDDLTTALEEGVLSLTSVRAASDRLRTELAAVEAQIAGATHADVLRPLVTASDVEQAWAACDLAQRRAVIDALMTITLLPPKKGRQAFDPETVRIQWRGAARSR